MLDGKVCLLALQKTTFQDHLEETRFEGRVFEPPNEAVAQWNTNAKTFPSPIRQANEYSHECHRKFSKQQALLQIAGQMNELCSTFCNTHEFQLQSEQVVEPRG